MKARAACSVILVGAEAGAEDSGQSDREQAVDGDRSRNRQ